MQMKNVIVISIIVQINIYIDETLILLSKKDILQLCFNIIENMPECL